MWISWLYTLPQAYVPDKFTNFNEIIVPTKENIRVSCMMSFMAGCGKNLLFWGPTGTCKTVCVLHRLKAQFSNETLSNLFMSFSAQTSANKIQLIMEGEMDKKTRFI